MSYLLKRSRNKVAVRELAAGLTFFTTQVLTTQIACIHAKRYLHLQNLVILALVRNACKAKLCEAKVRLAITL